jgi:hypothetical protein
MPRVFTMAVIAKQIYPDFGAGMRPGLFELNYRALALFNYEIGTCL